MEMRCVLLNIQLTINIDHSLCTACYLLEDNGYFTCHLFAYLIRYRLRPTVKSVINNDVV